MQGPDPAHGQVIDEKAAARAVQSMTRALLRVQTPDEAVALLLDTVERFGGEVVPASVGDADAIPVDLTFGIGEPLLPVATPYSVARMHLERYLPTMVEDVRAVVARLRRSRQMAHDALTDVLTGLPNRRAATRILGRLAPGDTVCLLDLDHFRLLNNTHGHQAGDEILQAFATVLCDGIRAVDHCARYGGEEFVVVLPRTPVDGAAHAVGRIRREWTRARPAPVTFSVGAAEVGPGEDADSVLRRVQDMVRRAKELGSDRTVLSGPDEVP